MKRDRLIRCLLAILCLIRLFMPSAVLANDGHEGELVITIRSDVVRIDADDSDVTETDIGNIHVENDPSSENTNGYALDVSASDDHTATVVTGTVELSKDSKDGGYYYGVNIDAHNGGHANVTTNDVDVNGMTKENDIVAGVRVDVDSMSKGGSSADVTSGNITVDNDTVMPAESGLDADVMAGFSSDKTAAAHITTGDISANNGKGIDVSSRLTGSEVAVDSGNISVGNGTGVIAGSLLGKSEVTVKDIEVTSGIGLKGSANGQSETVIRNQDIIVGDGKGIVAEALNNGSISIVADSLMVNGENGTAIVISARNNINSKDRAAISQEIIDDIETKLGRKLTEDELIELYNAFSLNSSRDLKAGENISIIVNGDVQAQNGIILDVTDTGNVDILIDGTLKAAKPISVSEATNLNNASLTLRKLDTQSTDENYKELINYIVDIRQGEENIFTVAKANGEALKTSHDYSVAKQGEELVLLVNDGYSITRAFNNGVELQKDEQGRFILNVAYGGGISFSVEYETIDSLPDPVPEKDDKAKEEIVVRFVPPTTGIDTSFSKSETMKKLIIHTLDILIVSLFLLSLSRRRNRNQLTATLMESR